MRGLYILKSETDKLKMELFGNIFTHYNYSTTDILLHSKSNITEISSVKSNFKIQIDQTLTSENVKLPTHSPFSDWKEARKFAGPLPFTFTYNKNKKEVLIIEGVREDWKPNPVYVSNYYVSFLKSLNLEHAILANAFIVNKIPYSWKKGKKEKWEA